MNKHNIFVVGASNTGKSTLAKKIRDTFDLKYVHAGTWATEMYETRPEEKSRAYIDGVTAYALDKLREDPNICITYLASQGVMCGKGFLVDGIRNPRDFSRIFDTQNDVAVILNYKENPIAPTIFEQGVEVITAYTQWLVSNGLLPENRVQNITYTSLEQLAQQTPNIIQTLRGI